MQLIVISKLVLSIWKKLQYHQWKSLKYQLYDHQLWVWSIKLSSFRFQMKWKVELFVWLLLVTHWWERRKLRITDFVSSEAPFKLVAVLWLNLLSIIQIIIDKFAIIHINNYCKFWYHINAFLINATLADVLCNFDVTLFNLM